MIDTKITNFADLQQITKCYLEELSKYKSQILVCSGAGCVSSNCGEVRDAIIEELKQNNLQEIVKVTETGCMGICAVGPVVLILPERTFYTKLTPEAAKEIVKTHIIKGEVLKKYTFYDKTLNKYIEKIDDIDFFKEQVKIALRNCGEMEYGSIDAYIARGGYYAACEALAKKDSFAIIEEIAKSGLKGRGGAGFPTAIKWKAVECAE